MVDADAETSVKDIVQTSETGGRQLWNNGRFKEVYDELGHCLGSGGMGTVWAARVSDATSSSRYRGRWVAVKAIPILLPESRAGSALHQGLRECLSTFQDLSSAHVVRYETYWLEEPEHLPEEMHPQSIYRPRAAQLKKEVQEDSPWVSSLRFRARAGSGNAIRRTRSSDVYPTPPGLSGSTGFIWDVDAVHPEVSHPPELSHPPSRVVWQDAKSTPKQVVLLIEMELMGPPPDGSVSDERRTSTLRSWLQNEQRTLSDAADVFGSLMLSVRHIHRKRIVHSDLKPDNIFCVAERSKVVVRIGDFGLAGENQLFRQFDHFSSKMLTTKAGMGGTPGYTAPEILCARNGHGTACSDKVDIYSCAVIMLELLLQPFRTYMERIATLDKFSQHKMVPGYVAMRLPKTRGLLQEMAESDPAARLSAEEVCKRFEKEVRKELCRSASQLCCDSSPAFEKCSNSSTRSQGAAKPDESGKRRKGRRRG